MIDDRNLQHLFGPGKRIGIAALACQEERAEIGQVILLDELAVGVFSS